VRRFLSMPSHLMALVMLAGLLAWAAPVSATDASSAASATPPGATVLSLDGPCAAVSWSPVADAFVYVVEGELREWPSGRRVELMPPRKWSPSAANPLGWAIRWRPDGRQLAVVEFKREAYVVDLSTFRVTRRLSGVSSVWWQRDALCFLPEGDASRFGARDRQSWRLGSRTRRGPRGLLFTDVSPEGEIMLANVATRGKPKGTFDNLALVRCDPISGRIAQVRRLHTRGQPVMEFTDVDEVQWNPRRRAAAILSAASTDGGHVGGFLLVADPERVHRVYDYYPHYFAFAEAKPAWVGDQVLTVIYLFRHTMPSERPGGGERIIRLVLWDPWQGEPKTLLEMHGSGEMPSAVSRDGKTAAVTIWQAGDTGSRLAILPLDQVPTLQRLIEPRPSVRD